MAKRIIVACIFTPVMLWIMLVPSPLVWTTLVCFISAMAAFELMRAAGEGKITLPMKVVTIIAAALMPLGSWAELGMAYVNLLSFVVTAVCFWCAIRAYDEDGVPIGFYHVLVALFGGVIIPLGFSALVELRTMDHGKYLVLLAVLLTFITDAGAYFAGVFLGKHRGITKVSPNKSAEGYIRSMLAKNVNLRNTPEITFILDQSIEYGVTMSKRIDEVNRMDESRRAGTPQKEG